MNNVLKEMLELYKKYDEVLNYLIIGALTTIVNLVTKYVLLLTIFDATNSNELQFSILISWVVAVLFAYVTNRKIVFKSKNNSILSEFINFMIARVATLVVEMIFMWFFVTLLRLNTDIMVMILSFCCQVLIIILNYIFSKVFVFKNK